jgi:hypothetical protein
MWCTTQAQATATRAPGCVVTAFSPSTISSQLGYTLSHSLARRVCLKLPVRTNHAAQVDWSSSWTVRMLGCGFVVSTIPPRRRCCVDSLLFSCPAGIPSTSPLSCSADTFAVQPRRLSRRLRVVGSSPISSSIVRSTTHRHCRPCWQRISCSRSSPHHRRSHSRPRPSLASHRVSPSCHHRACHHRLV